MTYHPVTSFRRPMDAVQVSRLTAGSPARVAAPVNKWHVLRDLTRARDRFGLSDRDLAVLQALLSFHPATELSTDSPAPIVFPSNAAICDRLNGMANSTMRRHLARLIDCGLLIRRDSPNGKRYTRHLAGARIAYGFDMTPLIDRAAEFAAAAEDARIEAETIQALRTTLSVMRRDIEQLADYGHRTATQDPIWDAYFDLARLTSRTLRRKLSLDQLTALQAQLQDALDDLKIRCGLVPETGPETQPETSDLSTSTDQNEQHYQNSDKDTYDSESAPDTTSRDLAEAPLSQRNVNAPHVPLTLVKSVCREIQTYSASDIRGWSDLEQAAERVSPMMGITSETLNHAGRTMGRSQAALALAAMLERFDTIRSPGAYLRALTRKAEAGEFTVAPMVMALRHRSAQGSQL